MAALKVKDYLPAEFAATVLGVEIADDLQYIVDNTALLESSISSKYTDIANTPAVVQELGLDYLLDLMQQTATPLLSIRAFLPALHAQKGTRYGLEFLLNLMGLSGIVGTAKIVEWWEDPLVAGAILPAAQRATPNTYKVRLELIAGGVPPTSIFLAFNKLSPRYVLPALDIGTVYKGRTAPQVQVAGRRNQVYYGYPATRRLPTQHMQAIGRTNTIVAGAAAR